MVAKTLVLHGFAMNAEITQSRLRTAQFLDAFRPIAEFHIPDAPHRVEPVPAPTHYRKPLYAWWRMQRNAAGMVEYTGWTETVSYLESYLHQNGPFDGVLGYSQGACLAGLLAGMQRRGLHFHQSPCFKFAVVITGFASRDATHRVAYESPIDLPSCHIIGRDDEVKEAGQKLSELFVNPMVLEFPMGHAVPVLGGNERDTLTTFVTDTLSAAKL